MIRAGVLAAAFLLALAATAEELEIPFELNPVRNVIVVKAKVNGKPATLILDTGATRTILSCEILAISPSHLKRARFSHSGPGVRAEAIWAKASLRLGEKRWRNRRVWVMNLQGLSRAYRERIDGVLGQDILLEFDSVEIDFRAKKLVLEQKK